MGRRSEERKPDMMTRFTVAIVIACTVTYPTANAATAAAKPAATAPAKSVDNEAAFQKTVALARAIKQSANDPQSVEIVSATSFPDGTVAITFRGRNAFNAKILNYAVWSAKDAAIGSSRDVARLWKKYVAGKSGTDQTGALHGAQILGAF